MWLVALGKTIFKFAWKSTIRRSFNTFGLYNNLRKYGGIRRILKNKYIRKKFIKKCMIDNGKRYLGKFNYIIDWKKKGFKYALKRAALGYVPMEIRKAGWFIKMFMRALKGEQRSNAIKQEIFNSIMNANELLSKYTKLSLNSKDRDNFFININDMNKRKITNSIDNIMNTRKNSQLRDARLDLKKDIQKKLQIQFSVRSPETHNFSQWNHKYSFRTENYHFPIRGWRWPDHNPQTKEYMYVGVPWKIIRQAILTSNYGKMVFKKYFAKYAKRPGRYVLKYPKNYI